MGFDRNIPRSDRSVNIEWRSSFMLFTSSKDVGSAGIYIHVFQWPGTEFWKNEKRISTNVLPFKNFLP